MLKCFFGLDLNLEGETLTDSSECRLGVNTLGLSAALSLFRSHMVEAFLLNNMTLSGLPMIFT